jgi:hypothetical protein
VSAKTWCERREHWKEVRDGAVKVREVHNACVRTSRAMEEKCEVIVDVAKCGWSVKCEKSTLPMCKMESMCEFACATDLAKHGVSPTKERKV